MCYTGLSLTKEFMKRVINKAFFPINVCGKHTRAEDAVDTDLGVKTVGVLI